MRRPLCCVGILATLAMTGCGNDLLFRNDHRITILSPANFDTVSQPLTVRWSARGFTTPTDGHFVAFFDLSPPSPGDTIDSYSPTDRQWIRTVDQTEVTAPPLPTDGTAPAAVRDHHEVTVILVDRSGRRIGETAGFVEFDVRT